MPGDIMVGDSDGVVAIPKFREEEVLATAGKINEAEEQILALLKQASDSMKHARSFNTTSFKRPTKERADRRGKCESRDFTFMQSYASPC